MDARATFHPTDQTLRSYGLGKAFVGDWSSRLDSSCLPNFFQSTDERGMLGGGTA